MKASKPYPLLDPCRYSGYLFDLDTCSKKEYVSDCSGSINGYRPQSMSRILPSDSASEAATSTIDGRFPAHASKLKPCYHTFHLALNNDSTDVKLHVLIT